MKLILLAIMFLTVGCSTLPNATVHYQHARTILTVESTQTVGCQKFGDDYVPHTSATVTYTPKYVVDPNKGSQFSFASLNRYFSDGNATVSLTDDGRLSSINTSTTGVGKTLTKEFATLITQTIKINGNRTVNEQCENLLTIAGKKLVLTIKGSTTVNQGGDFDWENHSAVLSFNERDSFLHTLMPDLFPATQISFTKESNAKKRITFSEEELEDAENTLQLNAPAIFKASAALYGKVFEALLMIPERGQLYDIIVPAGQLFGTNEMELEIGPAGNVTKVKYGSTSGVSDGIGSLNSLVEALDDSTSSTEQAAELKGQADIIAQQQRLIRCQVDPSTCV